jgi:hypothetical protein
MSELRFRIAMSLDGLVAGPRQSVDKPLGIGRHAPAPTSEKCGRASTTESIRPRH